MNVSAVKTLSERQRSIAFWVNGRALHIAETRGSSVGRLSNPGRKLHSSYIVRLSTQATYTVLQYAHAPTGAPASSSAARMAPPLVPSKLRQMGTKAAANVAEMIQCGVSWRKTFLSQLHAFAQ